MDNLEYYNRGREVPNEAKKTIKGGRLNGMTDINPMWRIKKLTELFGPCGIGWKYEITEKRLEPTISEQVMAFVDINLYIKADGQWSEPIPGTGGSGFVKKENSGLYASDECFKMALTDAISVACKALGIGADVYWDRDTTKYYIEPEDAPKAQGPSEIMLKTLKSAIRRYAKLTNQTPKTAAEIIKTATGVDVFHLTSDEEIEKAGKFLKSNIERLSEAQQ